MSDMVTIDRATFFRMSKALIAVEKMLKDKEEAEATWISEVKTLELLGCSKSTLYRLKGKVIGYKAIGKKHQYNKKSIEKYIAERSV